jgi:hypothetical protein
MCDIPLWYKNKGPPLFLSLISVWVPHRAHEMKVAPKPWGTIKKIANTAACDTWLLYIQYVYDDESRTHTASVSMQEDQWKRGKRLLKNCTDDADTWQKAKLETGKLQSCLHLTTRTRNNIPWQYNFIVDFLWHTENKHLKSVIYSSPYTDQLSDHIYNLSQNSASLQVVLLFFSHFNF